jgi:hypothetical protein
MDDEQNSATRCISLMRIGLVRQVHGHVDAARVGRTTRVSFAVTLCEGNGCFFDGAHPHRSAYSSGGTRNVFVLSPVRLTFLGTGRALHQSGNR